LVVAALAGGACADEPDGATASTGRPPDATTTTTMAPTSATVAVVTAYEESWTAFGRFVNGDASGSPSDVFAGDQLATVEERISQYADEGLELRGAADLAPTRVEVLGTSASLVDCQVDGTYAVDRASGDVVIPATARPQQVTVELLLADGRWKVSSVDYGAEGSCER
jgi:hypothetical protein